MKIISKFHDYYDKVGFYSDEPLWIRKTETLYFQKTKKSIFSYNQLCFLDNMIHDLPKPYLVSYRGYIHNHYQRYKILLIGGKLKVFYISCDNKPFFIHDYTLYMESICEHDIVNNRYTPFNNKVLKEWFNRFNIEEKLIDIHLILNSPLIQINYTFDRDICIEKNPCLKLYNLQKLIHPFEIWQDIEMFLSNQMAQKEIEMPDFGDEIKRDYHGMDEWSFKKKINTKKRKQKKSKIK